MPAPALQAQALTAMVSPSSSFAPAVAHSPIPLPARCLRAVLYIGVALGIIFTAFITGFLCRYSYRSRRGVSAAAAAAESDEEGGGGGGGGGGGSGGSTGEPLTAYLPCELSGTPLAQQLEAVLRAIHAQHPAGLHASLPLQAPQALALPQPPGLAAAATRPCRAPGLRRPSSLSSQTAPSISQSRKSPLRRPAAARAAGAAQHST